MTSNQITALTVYKEPKHKKQTFINLKNNTLAVLLTFLNRRKKYIFLFTAIYFVLFLFLGSYISLYPNAYSLISIAYDWFITKRLSIYLLAAAFIFGFTIFGRFVASSCAITTAICFGLFSSALYSFNFMSDLFSKIYLISLLSLSSLIFILFCSDSIEFSKTIIGNRQKNVFRSSLYFVFRFLVTISLITLIIYKASNLSMLG